MTDITVVRCRRCTISGVTGKALAYIRQRELLKPGDRVGVAVSGGADSIALLRVLLELRGELGIVLSVLHFNHKIRGAEADEDEKFASALAADQGLEFHHSSADVPAYAAEHKLNLEAAAREARYQFFESFLRNRSLDAIATGHTLDEQAETVLMRVLRGAGTKGLAGIYPKRMVRGCGGQTVGCIVRPLLGLRRSELRSYLASIHQVWREDASNADLQYTRNRIRHGLLPLIETRFQPTAAAALAQLAEVAREEESYWNAELKRVMPAVVEKSTACTLTLSVPHLLAFRPAMQRRILRQGAQNLGLSLDFEHLTELLRTVGGSMGKSCALPGGWVGTREHLSLRLERRPPAAASFYAYTLPIPGEVEIPEIGRVIRAFLRIVQCTGSGYNREQSLDPAAVGQELLVRNWQPGDRFRLPHSKASKKLKELFEQRHVSAAERLLWPVVASGGKLAWARGFGASAEFQPDEGARHVVVIEEHVPLARHEL